MCRGADEGNEGSRVASPEGETERLRINLSRAISIEHPIHNLTRLSSKQSQSLNSPYSLIENIHHSPTIQLETPNPHLTIHNLSIFSPSLLHF